MITTIEELDALPDGARIIDARGNALTLHEEEGEVSEWVGVGFSDWSIGVALPAYRIIPATISREKLSELAGALNCDYWDVVEIVEEVLHGLGIEVES